MYNHRFSKREFFLDNIALPLGRDGIDHSINILTILTLNDRKAIMANGGPKTRETWKLVVGLIQRPEDGINPLAWALKNSEHPCQVYLTNKTRCIDMFSRNACFLWDPENIFSFLFRLKKVCILMLVILHTIRLINSPQSCPQTTPVCRHPLNILHKSFLFSQLHMWCQMWREHDFV